MDHSYPTLADAHVNAMSNIRSLETHMEATPEKQTLLQQNERSSKTLLKSPIVSVREIPQDGGMRRTSTATTMGPQSGIFWRSPLTMVFTFLLGLASALALHGYYSSLNGKKVGDSNQQQTALRVGTTLAFITQVALVGSVHFAYVQCLWRALKRSVISVQAIDAGFGASNSLLSFRNAEMLSKLRLASFLALIAWCIPLSSLVTPATLNIDSVMHMESRMVNVSTLQISQAREFAEFAYSIPRQGVGKVGLQKYLGPRTVMQRWAVATATTGQILTLPAPYTNATYEQSFYGPFVQCQDANATVASQIDAAANRSRISLDPSINEVSLEYFAFVPALSNPNQTLDNTSNSTDVQVANLSDVNGALYASNQVWLRFPRYNDSDSNLNITQDPTPHYLTCALQNASYQVNFTWVNGIQSLDILDLNITDTIAYPTNTSSSSSDEEDMAYSAFMWALSDQLIGSMGFYQDTDANDVSAAKRTYSQIDSNIDQTSLLGSSDFNSYFIKNHALGGNSKPGEEFSTQRLQDMAFARNRTLDVLIEELSSNITLSLISNPLLSPSAPTNTTTTTPLNIYRYHPLNVFLSYSIAFFFALLANILGLYAYNANGVSHDNSFSSIVCTTRDIHLSRLNAHERLGALPLDRRVGRTKLRFDVGDVGEEVGEGGEGGKTGSARWGFGIA